MAKSTLPVDFTDDVLNESMSGKRRYKLIYNDDGTVSLEDVTAYDQIGSDFGSKQVNETNTAVNAAADAGKIIDSLATVRAVTQEGYMAGALALKELDDSLASFRVVTITKTFNASVSGYIAYARADYDYIIPLGIKSDNNVTSMQIKTHINENDYPTYMIVNGSVAQDITAHWLLVTIG